MKTDKQSDKERRAAKVSAAKAELMDVFGGVAPFKAEAPEISVELTPFKVEVIAPTMPGRDFNHERIAFTEKVLVNILNHVVNYGIIAHACISQGVSYRQFGDLCKAFPALQALKDEAKDLYRDKVSRAVHNRAIDGWLEPVFYKGELIGYIRKFSDRMLELQAKRYIPEYRDKAAVDLSVAGGVLVVFEGDIQDKEEWLTEQRKRRQIESHIVEP
jgi:hypothetical protein